MSLLLRLCLENRRCIELAHDYIQWRALVLVWSHQFRISECSQSWNSSSLLGAYEGSFLLFVWGWCHSSAISHVCCDYYGVKMWNINIFRKKILGRHVSHLDVLRTCRLWINMVLTSVLDMVGEPHFIINVVNGKLYLNISSYCQETITFMSLRSSCNDILRMERLFILKTLRNLWILSCTNELYCWI